MSVRSAQAITKLFTTRAFATGAATDATGTPTGTLYVNGTADAASVTVTNITTGVYKAAVTLPTLAVGDIVDMRINATVSAVTDNAIIWSDTKDLALDSSFRPGIDWANVGSPTTTLALTGTTIGTLTTYTGNTPQTGDAYAIVNSGTFGNAAIKGYVDDIGVAGAGLTALGDARLANLDALVSSRMATYTQPTGFLAATFPGTLASTTNITAGTITTVGSVTTVNSLSATALAGFFTTDSTKVYADAVAGSVVKETASGAGGGGLTQADVRQAVGLATANLDTQLSGIDGKTTNLPPSPAAVGSAMTLTSGERDSIAAALLDLADGVETGYTLKQALRLIAATVAGQRSNCGTTSEQYDALGAPGTARVVGNLDSSGDGTPTLTP